MNRLLFALALLLIGALSYSEDVETNEVVLPETKFTVQGVSPSEMTDRNVIFESSTEKSTIKEIPSLKEGVFELEREVKGKDESKSRIVSYFSYGLGDIIDFSLAGMSEIPTESYSVNMLLKYSRFKRPDVVYYSANEIVVLKNTLRDIDLVSFSLNHFTKSTFLTLDWQFFEDFKGLWANSYFSDEGDRNVSVNGIFNYNIDRDSRLISTLKLDHTHINLRSNNFDKLPFGFNDFFLNLGYQYGVDEYNSFKFELGIGANLISKSNLLMPGVYGDVSMYLAFPLYMNTVFLVSSLSLIPDYFFPFEVSLKLGCVYKINQNISIYLDLNKEVSKLKGDELIKGVTFIDSKVRDSAVGAETGIKVFFGGENSLKLTFGYNYYFSKYYNKPVIGNFLYVLDVTNLSSFYSKVSFDVLSLDWLTFGLSYNFNLNFPFVVPYSPLHSLDAISKFNFDKFSLSLSFTGEYLNSSDGVNFDISPYAILSIDSEYEIIKNLLLSLKLKNLLNNIAEIRKNSVISEGIYASLGIKIKL